MPVYDKLIKKMCLYLGFEATRSASYQSKYCKFHRESKIDRKLMLRNLCLLRRMLFTISIANFLRFALERNGVIIVVRLSFFQQKLLNFHANMHIMIIDHRTKEAIEDYFYPKAILFDVIRIFYNQPLQIFVFLSTILSQSYLQQNFNMIENMRLNDGIS